MAKISLAELSRAVATKHHLSQREAERFITTFVDVANEALRYEKQLKVKGLGTFKVIDTKDRESVDVNSGERIVIEGRGKITFTPDSVMRDLVNKPFAQFQTVVLNDGVDFSDIDNATLPSEDALMSVSDTNASPASVSADTEQSSAASKLEVIEQPEQVAATEDNEPSMPVSKDDEQPEPAPEDSEHAEPVLKGNERPEAALKDDKHAEPILKDNEHPELASEDNEQFTPVLAPVEEATQVEFADVASDATNSQPVISISESDQQADDDLTPRAALVDFAETTPKNMNVVNENKKSYRRILWTLVSLLLIVGGTVMGDIFGKNSSSDYVSTLENEKIALLDSIARIKAQYSTSEALSAQEDRIEAEAAEAREDSIREKQLAEERVKEEARERARQEAATKARHDSLAKAYAMAKAKAEQEARIRVEARMKAKQKEEAAKAAAAKTAAAKAAQAKKKTESTQNAAASKMAQQYASSNAQVRLGAYNIVGLDQTVTVRKGQTLASISKAFFGPGMECYVQAFNGGITAVKEGMKLKIPKLQLKKKSSKK